MVLRHLTRSILLYALLVSLSGRVLAAETPTGAVEALDAAVAWLSAHPTDPASDRIAYVTFDVWAWDVISQRHPSSEVRKRAAGEIAARLAGLPPPEPPTDILISYWAVLLRLMQLHGHVDQRYREAAAKADLKALLASLSPTTTWWTLELLRYSGLPTTPSFEGTFIATNAGATRYEPTATDVYQLFHEVVPSSDLGRRAPKLTPQERAFALRVLPPSIRMSREKGDTDGVAEGLVTATLVGADREGYADNYRWLLDQQRPDGSFRARRDTQKARDADHFRHVMAVGTWAVAIQIEGASSPRAE